MGFDEASFKRDCRRLTREVKRAIGPAVDRASNLLAGEIRRRCPVDTGALKASVTVKPVRPARGRIVQDVTIGSGLEHPEAAQVEYGTHDTTPVPFIRGAIGAKETKMVATIEAALQKE